MRLNNPMTVAGWGVTTEGSSFLAEMLQEVKVPVVSVSRCKQALGQYDITDNMLCAGGVEDQDACQGDSGGPLMGTEPGTKQVSPVIIVATSGAQGVTMSVCSYTNTNVCVKG